SRVGANAKIPIFFNQLLNPYIKNDQVWSCPSSKRPWVNIDAQPLVADNFQSYGGQNSYGASNYLFRSNNGIGMAAVVAPADTVAMTDAMYYNVLPKNPCRLASETYGTSTSPVDPTSSSYPRYWKNIGNSYINFAPLVEPSNDEAEKLGKSRHSEQINTIF